MDKLDKQFEQIMKGVKLESPSKGFTMNVMQQIQAEAVIQKRSLIEEYEPVISLKTWILMIAGFIGLMVYILLTGHETAQTPEIGLMANVAESVSKLNTQGISNMWQSVNGLLASIPSVAYLIILASSALWTLDFLLTHKRRSQSTMQVN